MIRVARKGIKKGACFGRPFFLALLVCARVTQTDDR